MSETTYKTVVIGGVTRLTRAPSVVSPLPEARASRMPLNRYARVASFQEKTHMMNYRITPICIPVYALRDTFL